MMFEISKYAFEELIVDYVQKKITKNGIGKSKAMILNLHLTFLRLTSNDLENLSVIQDKDFDFIREIMKRPDKWKSLSAIDVAGFRLIGASVE